MAISPSVSGQNDAVSRPDGTLEAAGQDGGVGVQHSGTRFEPEAPRAAGGQLFSGEDVRLYLSERDGPDGEPPAGMENGIDRVLPALVEQRLVGRARIYARVTVEGNT
jgi:hypothetical protein